MEKPASRANENEQGGLRVGGVYLLDDYSHIQILSLAEGWVAFRSRPRFRLSRTVVRNIRMSKLRGRIRAEVDGGFFPDLVDAAPPRDLRPSAQRLALDTFLAERALTRPF